MCVWIMHDHAVLSPLRSQEETKLAQKTVQLHAFLKGFAEDMDPPQPKTDPPSKCGVATCCLT